MEAGLIMWDAVLEIWGSLSAAGGAVFSNAWIAICMAFWGGGLWILGFVLSWSDQLLTPPLDDAGFAPIYGITLWIGLVLAILFVFVQIITTAVKQDGRGLAELLVGSVKFLLVCAVWLTYCSSLLVAVQAINRGLRKQLFGVSDAAQWELLPMGLGEEAVSAVTATVLLVLSLMLWVGALTYVVVLLGRSVALVVLVATAPIAAAGLVLRPLHAWFWKSLRWFHAAAFAPVLMTLMLGLGVRITTNVSLGGTGDAQAALGAVVPGVMMILISSVAPVALFRFLAFVDPGTSSGAAFRAGLVGTHHPTAPAASSTARAETAGNAAETTTAHRTTNTSTSSITPTPGGSSSATGAASSSAANGASAAPGSTAGATAPTAGGAAAAGAGAGGVLGAGVVVGAKALVEGFRRAGAMATGVVGDVGSTTGAGDAAYPYDPVTDARRPWQQPKSRDRINRRQPHVSIREEADG